MSVAVADLALLSRLFDEAAALPVAERESWIDALPAGHRHLAAALRAMLATGSDRSAAGARDTTRTGPRLTPPGPALRAGDRVGPYELQRPLGSGGMGTVWLAERTDGHPRRPVALKLPRLAWDEHLAERMARERDIVARLEHPNIARLYDAGVDAQGRPFLALAYIDGLPIDRWCDERQATTRQRLLLMLQVVRAVAFAHARLVVHRDIKPSNVLVDAEGRAHLLDFGVAALLDADDGLTREHGRALTPRIAPPELLRGEPATVACDVYELGLLMHELLAGRLPDRPGAALDADPPPASRSAVDEARRRALRGDLDAIVALCLRPDPLARYASAEALADDLERHLDGLPVRARDGRLGYRLGKALRRHRIAAAATAAALVALVAGTTVSLVQAGRARAAAERSQLVKGFVVDLFKVNQPGQDANAELRRLPAELLLDRGASRVAERFPGQPALQAELHGVVAGIFADMGAHAQALRHADLALAAQREAGIAGADTAHRIAAQALLAEGRLAEAQARADEAWASALPEDATARIEARLLKADAQRGQGQRDAAKDTLAEAESLLQRAPQAGDRTRARALHLRARLTDETRFAETPPLYEAAIRAAIAADGPASGLAADIRLDYAARLALHARHEQAGVVFEQAVHALRDGGVPGRVRAAMTEANQSTTLYLMGQRSFAATAAVIGHSRDELAALGSGVPEDLRTRLALQLGSVLAMHGDLERAWPLLQEASARLEGRIESARERMLLAAFLGLAAMQAGEHARADELLRERRSMRGATGAAAHPYAAFDTAYVALNLAHAGRHAEAEAEIAQALARLPQTSPSGLAPISAEQILWHARVRIALLRGDVAAARSGLPRAYTDFRQLPFDAALLAAEVACAQREPGASDAVDAALAQQQGFVHEQHPEMTRAHGVAGLCALQAGQRRRAAGHLAAAEAALSSQPRTGEAFRRPAAELRRRLAGA